VYLLGTPLAERDRLAFRASILERHGGDVASAYAFVDRVLDRVAEKSATLLTFNSIFVALTFALHIEAQSAVALLGTLLASFSCLLLLSVVALNWHRDSGTYRNIEVDFDRNLKLCIVRGACFTFSLYLSVGSIGLFLWSLLSARLS
jgi:hypothetical protein